jgi:DNA-binding transcriptional LysR family regulator
MCGWQAVAEIQELKVLHCLVKQSSWTKAAAELGVARAELEQVVARLEQRLGVTLLQTDAESVALTEAGAAFHARTGKALDELAKAEAALTHAEVQPMGKLRLSVPVVLGQAYVTPLIRQLRQRFPDLAIELSLMDRFVDLVHEEVDLAIRVGSPFDSRLMSRRLCKNRRVLVASPAYLEQHGTPQSPEDLCAHDCILFTSSANPRQWRVTGPNGTVALAVSGMLSSNNGNVLNSLAEQGLGITFGATLALAPALQAGRLVRVLSPYEMEETAIFAVYPAASRLPTKVAAVVDFFAEQLTDPPIWDRQLIGRAPGF